MFKRVTLILTLCVLGATALRASEAARPDGSESAPLGGGYDELIAAAKKSMMTDPNAALRNAQAGEAMAERMSTSTDRSTDIATSLWLEAEALTRINRIDDARIALDRAIRIASEDGSVTKLDGDLALSEARIADHGGDVALALKSFQRAHDIFAKLGLARSQSMALQGLGAIYDEAHDFVREIRYYNDAERIYSNDPNVELSIANNLGFALQQMGRYDEAIKNFQRALEISRQLKSDLLQVIILPNLAAVYAKEHNFAAATNAADEALRHVPQGDENDTALVWGVKAQIDFARGAKDLATRDLDRAFRGIDLKTTSSPFRDMHEIAYRVYRAQGNLPLAMAHLEAFKRLDDEGRSLAASANLALIGAQFDFATQRWEIEHLRSEQLKRDMSLRESRAAMQTVIFAAVMLGVVLLMLWIGWRHLLVRRHRNAITQKNVELTRTLAERDVEIVRRTEVEADLRLATQAAEQANRAKSQFLANMSHELRTPLNAIIGFSELMAHGAIAGPKLVEYATDINTSGQNLLAILNDILDMARIDAGNVTLAEKELLLGEIVESAVCEIENSTASAGKSIRVENDVRAVRVCCDDKRMRQILVNLLSNAVKFTGRQGVVSVRIEMVEDGVDVVVSDNGVGIPEDKLATVMEPFGQAESAYARLHGGVGLGLPIVRALVRLHGGRFTLTSEVDAGTAARVHLPAERVLGAYRAGAVAAAS